ncbi:MAG: AsmA family protein [Candidatus Abyssobacteria bacterium SURF_5]|uniref:AsmA family protein n=1 Tax=Abyssobacteria bacterium (strain SURF_5) TaxID=2093360 RepID=A0A3A4P6W4_ABYX5|nr:MAG: AsmA family protein [Candidatus Abyssubacteria bacterium SURF_5]
MRTKYILIAAGALILIVAIVISVVLIRFDYNTLKPRAERAVYQATGRELNLEGDVKLHLGLSPILAVESVTFENAEWGSQPNMATMERLEVQVALIPLLRRDIQVKNLVLVGPDILVETSKTGESNISFGQKPKKEEQPPEPKPGEDGDGLKSFTFEEVRIENGRLTYKDQRKDTTHTATLLSFQATEKSGGLIQMEAEGAYNENPFEMEGTVGSLAAITDPQDPWPVKLRAKTLGTDVHLNGAVQDVLGAKGIDLNLIAEGQSLTEVATLAGVKEVPDLGKFDLSARLTDPAENTYKLSDIKAHLSNSDISGTAEFSMEGERPRFSAAFESQVLDLRSIMAEEKNNSKKTEPAGQTQSTKQKVFSENELPLDIVKKVDGEANLQAKHILLPRLALTDLATKITLNNGTLAIQPIQASAGGGSFAGQLNLSAKAETADLNVNLKIDQLDLERMLSELGIVDRIYGKLDADIELTGNGDSVAELMAGLDGKTVMSMGGGRINNKYLSLLEGDFGSGLFRLLYSPSEGMDYTELQCFVSRFDIKNGLAKSTVLLIATESITVAGEGIIDLRTEELDLAIVPAAKEGVLAEAGARTGVDIGELSKSFRLGGTLANPRLAIDPRQPVTIISQLLGGKQEPSGIAAVLAGESEGDDPCSIAMNIAETGEVPQAAPKKEEGTITEQLPADMPGKDVLGEAEQQLRKLFGK